MSQKKFTNATGNWTVGQNEEINYAGKAKLEGSVQATDFLDADGNSIIGASEYVNVDTGLKLLKVGTLPILDPNTSGGSGYCVAVGMQANFGGYVHDQSVGIGVDAKAVSNAVAVGLGTEARPSAVAIGRSAQAWDKAMALGSGTWATHDYSVAIGKGAKTEEPNQVMFGATPDDPYSEPVNLKTYGTIQATDFLDADGKSIIGGGSDYVNVDEEKSILNVGTLAFFGSGGGSSVAVGLQGATGGFVEDYAVAVGVNSKALEQSVAMGYFAEARNRAVAIGQGAQAWASAMAIGHEAGAVHDFSVAIGRNANAEEPNQVMFGATPDHPYGKPLNLKTYGTMQATDFLDADGESIIGAGGITAEFDPSFVYEEPWKGEEVGAGPVWVVGDGLSASLLHTDGHLVATTSEFRSVKAINIDTHAPFYGSVSSGNGFFTEATVFGGINITALDQARPEELPFDLTDEEANAFKSQSRSIQYALTVTHETLGRTVEIDKEGIIRANQFTDMDGNPIGGGGGDPEWADIQFNLGPDDYALAVTSSGGLSVGPLTNLVHPTGIALGREASSDQFGLAAGFKANAGAFNSIAFGYRADSKHQYSIALGHAATTTKDSQLKISPNITEVDFSSAVVQAKDYLDANGDSIKVDLSNYPQSTTVNNFVTLTQSQYNLLPNKDSNTIYFIQE